MRITLAVVALLALTAGTLSAQTYANSPYTTGYYSGGIWLQNVVIKQGTTVLLSNNSGPNTASPYNTYFSAISPANLIPGQVHTIECTMGNYTCCMSCTAWIDYNNDGTYDDSSERIGYTASGLGASAVGIISFTPPTGVGGVRRLRIRHVYSNVPPHTAYASYSYGEAEDYNVNLGFAISTPSPLPTGAQGTAYTVNITATNGTAPYNWQGSPSYIISGSLPAGLTAAPIGSPAALRISGTPTGTGTSNFTVSVNDSASNNATKAYQITIVPPPAAMPFSDDFETDKGWQTPSPWARGVATAFTQSSPACSEPGTDHSTGSTSNRILGDTIGGKYATSMSGPVWAISPMVNCAGASTVRLVFWRWLGLAIGSEVKVEVSNNGTTWTNVWTSTSGTTYGGSTTPVWTSVFYDITAQAAGFATVQVRFGIGPTGTTALTGWCIDDFLIEQPTSDMRVQEVGATGPVITDDQAVGGGRNFGTIGVSQQSPPLTIYITNNGPTNITFGAFAKVGANPTDFYINSSAMTNPLPPSTSTSFTIIFYRTSAGTSSAQIQLPHNALYSGTSPFDINVTGTAIVPQPIIRVNLGSATGPQITHQQSPTGTPRDFGNQTVGTTSSPITIFVTNAGTGTLAISTPDMGGTWWTEFTVNSAGMASQLAAGVSTSFQVSFAPTSIGSKTNTYVRIAHTDGTQASPFYVPVIGNGTSASGGAAVEVHEGLVTGPTFSHNDPATGTARDFGNQLVAGGPTAALTITIENSGGAALTLGTPVLGGTNPTEFVLSTTGFQTSVNPGANTSFTVAFDPSSVGVKVATVTFTHNDTNVTSPFIINLRGNGVTTAPSIEVRENGPGGAALTNPAPATGILDFGTQDVNSGPTAAATIYVENTGTANLTVGIPGFQTPSTEFQLQVTGFAGTLAPAASATFTITFDPTTAGTHTAIVEFTHNDSAAGSPFVLNLTGDAVLNAPQLEVREGTTIGPVVQSGDPAIGSGRDCGSIGVTAGGSIPVTVVIMNTGTQNMTLGMPTLGGNNAADFVLLTGGFTTTVAAGANTSFAVSFDPNLAGMKDCTVQFTHNDPGATNPFVLNFVGTGTDPNAVTITTPSLPAAIPDVAYGPMQIEAVQGTTPYIWSIYSGNLPGGLGLSTAGVLSGTPSGFGGTFNVIIRVQDQTGATNERAYTIVVSGDLSGRGKAKDGGCSVEAGSSTGLLALIAALGIAIAGLRLTRRNA